MSAWNSGDAAHLRTYLADHSNFLETVKSMMPKSRGITIEERAISGAERAGSEKVLEIIEELRSYQSFSSDSPYVEGN